MGNKYRLGHGILRVGVAFAFIYPPLVAIADPFAWAGYFPTLISIIPIDTVVLLHIFGIIEIILALWILSGVRLKIPAILATLCLLTIVAFNLSDFDVLFRDVSLALSTLALVFLPNPNE